MYIIDYNQSKINRLWQIFILILSYSISDGSFETVKNCRYTVPDYTDIGKLYAYMIEDITKDDDITVTITEIFNSFLSDEISDFNTDLYYQNISYLEACYYEKKILN